ncbi:MAG TPA: M28 family metallopeptidase [Candidatus Polarisedimenticolia bacterium]|nr:M28 family metallopeptidase [Candidatus Polarisedimenticolia bacterium]
MRHRWDWTPGRARSSRLALGLFVLTLLAGADPSGKAPVPEAVEKPGDAEALLQSLPSSESYGRHLRFLTKEPHQTGTPRNMLLADYVRDRFLEYGLEEVTFHDTPALMTYGKESELSIIAPDQVTLKLTEDPHPADSDSHLYDDPAQVPFHGYAPSGDVTGEVVYANGGAPEDFAILDRMGIPVRGRIVLMRYSEPYSYRGTKIFEAERRGAIGTILYSDPEDDGAGRGAVYPEGPWGPLSHMQWGAVLYDWLGPGEPFTFHWKQEKNGAWVEGRKRDKQLPRLPSLPLSARNASLILERLKGPRVPDSWQGGLPMPYRIGPGPAAVHLRTVNEEKIGTLRNVLAVLRGTDEPDRLILIGNHRDAWIYGAVDPSSGTAALLETVRALGTAARKGFRPRRTILFANWDGEEQLLGGSTQFAIDHAESLAREAVAYVNVDSGVAGADLEAGATPALADFVRQAAASVRDPNSGDSLLAAWEAHSPERRAKVGTIVGATDYTAFQEHLGISCIDLAFGGSYGVYHSMYDDYFWMSTIGDPGFRYGAALARLWSVMTWRLANAPLLPMRYSEYARKVLEHVREIEVMGSGGRHALKLDSARAAAKRWQQAATGFETTAATRSSGDLTGTAATASFRAVNDLLMQVERSLTEPQGLVGRPFYRHLIYAPQPTYREEVLPRLWEAIDRGETRRLPAHERELVAAFDRAASLMQAARAALPAATVAAAAAPAAAHPDAARREFRQDVLPILEARCNPCHFPGGVMHGRLPFEVEGTSRVLGTRLFTRLRDPDDEAVIRAWLEQEAGAPRAETEE